MDKKQFAASVSVISNTFLIISKLIVGFLSGSISIISEAFHSFSDLFASFIAYFSVKKTALPPDLDHPYGHGKYEELSGLFEGLLIFAVAVYIAIQAINKLLTPMAHTMEPMLGIMVMVFSMIINIAVSFYLSKIGEETDSIALKADALHLRTDVYSSLVILIGLILIKITGISIIDPILALIIAFIITFTSIKLCRQTVKNLLDSALPEQEIQELQTLLNNHLNKDIVEIKNLRTRKSGAQRLIQITIIVHKNITIMEGHNICDIIEKEILDLFNNKATISIHLEPCNNECKCCYSK